MKIHFQQKDPGQIIETINDSITDPNIAKIVSFLHKADQLIVIISRLGKSQLTFSIQTNTKGTTFTLIAEKIALAHRVFQDEVTKDIKDVVRKAGGNVQD